MSKGSNVGFHANGANYTDRPKACQVGVKKPAEAGRMEH